MLFYVRDRRKAVPKKPVDVALKENMKPSINLNKTDSMVNRGLKDNRAQNCTFEKKLNGPSNNELIKESKDSSNVGPSKITISNEPSVEMKTELTSKECSELQTVSKPISSSKGVLPLKTFGKDIIPNSTAAEDLPSLPRCMNSNFLATNSENSLAKAGDVEINHVNRGLGVPVITSLNLVDANISAIPQAVS